MTNDEIKKRFALGVHATWHWDELDTKTMVGDWYPAYMTKMRADQVGYLKQHQLGYDDETKFGGEVTWNAFIQGREKDYGWFVEWRYLS